MLVSGIVIILIFAGFIFLILNSAEAKKGEKKRNTRQVFWILVGIVVLPVIGVFVMGKVMPLLIGSHGDKVAELVRSKYPEIQEITQIKENSTVGKYFSGKYAGYDHGRFAYSVTDTNGETKIIVVDWLHHDGTYEITTIR